LTDKPLRFIFAVLMAINFLLIGPIMVGIPVLADHRLPEGAMAFGLLMSAFAGGNLLGYLVAGSLPRPNGAKLRLITIALFAGFGIVIGSLGTITSTWIDFGLLFLLGLGNGFMAVLVMTWIQTRTPQEMLGRMMALLMLASIGLMPISQAIAGVLSKWNLTMLFVLPGVLVLLMTIWMAFHPDLKGFSESLTAAQAEG
jgi:MFS family permease